MGDGARPKVTVGIPVYNEVVHIGQAISSVLDQDYADFEVLVVDNASDDGTFELVSAIVDPRVRILRNDTNIGAGPNWNRVLTEARGDYVKLLSADDYLLPGALAEQARILDSDPGVVLVTATRVVVDKDGRRVMERGPREWRGRIAGGEAIRRMVRTGTNKVGEPSAAMLRRSALADSGLFDAAAPYCVDMDLWMRLLAHGDLYVIPTTLSAYRVSEGSWSAAVLDRQAADVIDLLVRVRAGGVAGVTEADVARGSAAARRNAVLRRAIYFLSGDSENRQRLLYLLVGGWNTALGYASFALLYALLAATTGYAAVFVLSYAVSMLNAYWCYKTFVFRTSARFSSEFPRFALVYVATLVVNIAVFPSLKDALRLDPYLSQAVFTVFVVIVTYVLNKRFSFQAEGRS